MTTIDFQPLRDQWALKYIATEADISFERNRDRNANPHNDGEPKKPRRDDAEIISDLAFTFADKVLKTQYGWQYTDWLKENNYTEVWYIMKRK